MTEYPKHRKSRITRLAHSATIFVILAFIMVIFLAALYVPDYFRDP